MAEVPLSPEVRPKPCPICGKPPVAAATPFCSKRCADVDLHKWLGGYYAVPARETDDEDSVPDQEPPED